MPNIPGASLQQWRKLLVSSSLRGTLCTSHCLAATWKQWHYLKHSETTEQVLKTRRNWSGCRSWMWPTHIPESTLLWWWLGLEHILSDTGGTDTGQSKSDEISSNICVQLELSWASLIIRNPLPWKEDLSHFSPTSYLTRGHDCTIINSWYPDCLTVLIWCRSGSSPQQHLC